MTLSMETLVGETVDRILTLDKTLYGWSGAPGQDIQKINFVFFYVLVPLKGRVVARKVAGTRSVISSVMKIVFSSNLLRSRDKVTGQRRVVLPKDLKVTEDAYPAGQAKEMRVGARSFEFMESRPSDCGMLEVLHRMATDPAPVVTESVVFPRAFLGAHSALDYSPRHDGRIIELLKNCKNYNELGSIPENFHACFDECFARGVDDRFMIDYHMVTGRGIPYLDLASVHPTHVLSGDALKINCANDVFVLDIESAILRVADQVKRKDD